MPVPETPLIVKFEQKYMPEPMSGCWLWTGGLSTSGYGVMNIAINGRRRMRRAHRISFEMVNGPIPPGMDLCHKCDTPTCVNPDHLFVGTRQDNMMDRVHKGRHAFKKRNHCKRGHTYTPENTKMRYWRGSETRLCRQCVLINNTEYHSKRRVSK